MYWSLTRPCFAGCSSAGGAMNRYKVTKQLGDGTYGSVLKAVNRSTGEVVRVTECCCAAVALSACEPTTRPPPRAHFAHPSAAECITSTGPSSPRLALLA